MAEARRHLSGVALAPIGRALIGAWLTKVYHDEMRMGKNMSHRWKSEIDNPIIFTQRTKLKISAYVTSLSFAQGKISIRSVVLLQRKNLNRLDRYPIFEHKIVDYEAKNYYVIMTQIGTLTQRSDVKAGATKIQSRGRLYQVERGKVLKDTKLFSIVCP